MRRFFENGFVAFFVLVIALSIVGCEEKQIEEPESFDYQTPHSENSDPRIIE